MKKKVSIVIPYCNRLENLKYVLRSISEQTMSKDEYEVIIGCLEISEPLAELINKEYSDMDIIAIMTKKRWNTAYARNIALKLCKGEYIVFVDADMVLPQKSLELYVKEHEADERVKLILGQAKSYDEWDEYEKIKRATYEEYKEKFLIKEESSELPIDRRLQTEILIPWAMCWTGFISIPRQAIFDNELFFDEKFTGWGCEDIEWGHRVQQAGVITVLPEKIWAIHLPHERDAEANHEYERVNFKAFIKKSPCIEVEVVTRFGDFNGNQLYKELKMELDKSNYNENDPFYIIEKIDEDSKELYIGAKIKDGKLLNMEDFLEIDHIRVDYSAPLLGISLPYDNKEFDKVYISNKINSLTNSIQDIILEEVERIGKIIIRG